MTLYNSSQEFRDLLDAVWNEDAVEGSMFVDDIEAARMLRKQSPDGSPIRSKNLATLRHSLMVVMRRWGISRAERRERLGELPTATTEENDDTTES